MTKLIRPRAARYHLPRPHLDRLLDEGLSRRLTVLLATAGHGKTSTVAQFLADKNVPSLWLQLDARDSDLRTFLRYLAIGIRDQLNGGSRLWSALQAEVPFREPLSLIISDLHECSTDRVIVLDDFHLIMRDSPVVELVASLVQYADAGTHLFICSRTPLPFSTARLKVTQEAIEITEEDLRFTKEETQTFLDSVTDLHVDGTQVESIYHLTEGWSAALVLISSGIRRRGSLEPTLHGALPNDLFSYLADEVFRSLSPSLQRFMEESSILDTLAATSCDEILGRQDSAAMLSQMIGSNLLLTQLGADSFRYHHLLQRFLQERLRARETGDFARLNRVAGDWFLSQDEYEEAVKHCLLGGWVHEAAGLVESIAPVWLRTHRLDRLMGLVTQIPHSVMEQYPWMGICTARHLFNSGKADHAVGMARRSLRAFTDYGDQRGIVHARLMLGECFAYRQEVAAGEEEFRLVAEALTPDMRHEEGLLAYRRAAASYIANRAPECVEADLRQALTIFVELGDLPAEAAVSDLLGVLRAQRGDYASAIQNLERSTAIMRSMGDPVCEAGTNLAWVYGEVGRFRDAVSICEPMFAGSSRKVRRAHVGLYLLHDYTRLGKFARAVAIAPGTSALVEEVGTQEMKTDLTVELSGLFRLSGRSQSSVPFANEALKLAREGDRSHLHIKAIVEAVLLHLFHTGNSGNAAKMASKALTRLGSKVSVLDEITLTLSLAVAQFRLTRTESRPDAVRTLQSGLTECLRRNAEFFVLHEWPLAMAVVIYGLAYDVQPEFCIELIRYMKVQLPPTVLQEGIPLAEPEARLLPAAWQALPDESSRAAFSALLTSVDRRRVMSLTNGPAPLQIQALGPLVVTVGGVPIDVRALRKRKSGQLLVLLLTTDGPTPREQIMDRLWPDLDADAADTSLRVSLHHLRRLLEPHLGGKQKSRYIQTEGGLMWFSRQSEVQVDLDAFREERKRGVEAREEGNLAAAASHYERVTKLYRGDLAADDPYALEHLREVFRNDYTEALDWLGEYYWHETQDATKAVLTFQRRLTVDETHEPAHQALMRIYMETGQPTWAHQQYLTCREVLESQLGVTPSKVTESLLQLAVQMECEAGPQPESPPAPVKSIRSGRRRQVRQQV